MSHQDLEEPVANTSKKKERKELKALQNAELITLDLGFAANRAGKTELDVPYWTAEKGALTRDNSNCSSSKNSNARVWSQTPKP